MQEQQREREEVPPLGKHPRLDATASLDPTMSRPTSRGHLLSFNPIFYQPFGEVKRSHDTASTSASSSGQPGLSPSFPPQFATLTSTPIAGASPLAANLNSSSDYPHNNNTDLPDTGSNAVTQPAYMFSRGLSVNPIPLEGFTQDKGEASPPHGKPAPPSLSQPVLFTPNTSSSNSPSSLPPTTTSTSNAAPPPVHARSPTTAPPHETNGTITHNGDRGGASSGNSPAASSPAWTAGYQPTASTSSQGPGGGGSGQKPVLKMKRTGQSFPVILDTAAGPFHQRNTSSLPSRLLGHSPARGTDSESPRPGIARNAGQGPNIDAPEKLVGGTKAVESQLGRPVPQERQRVENLANETVVISDDDEADDDIKYDTAGRGVGLDDFLAEVPAENDSSSDDSDTDSDEGEGEAPEMHSSEESSSPPQVFRAPDQETDGDEDSSEDDNASSVSSSADSLLADDPVAASLSSGTQHQEIAYPTTILKHASGDRLYTTWLDSGTLITAAPAIFPDGYEKCTEIKGNPWICSVRSCRMVYGSTMGIGSHFTFTHKRAMFNDNMDGTLSFVGSYTQKNELGKTPPVVVSKRPLDPKEPPMLAPSIPPAKQKLSAPKNTGVASYVRADETSFAGNGHTLAHVAKHPAPPPPADPKHVKEMWAYMSPYLTVHRSIPHKNWVQHVLHLPRVRELRWNEERMVDHPYRDTHARDITALIVQITGIEAPVPCIQCSQGKGPFAGCIMISPDAPSDAKSSIVSCANCYYHCGQSQCSHCKTTVERRDRRTRSDQKPDSYNVKVLSDHARRKFSTAPTTQQQAAQGAASSEMDDVEMTDIAGKKRKIAMSKPKAAVEQGGATTSSDSAKKLWDYMLPYLPRTVRSIAYDVHVHRLFNLIRRRDIEWRAGWLKDRLDDDKLQIVGLLVHLTGVKYANGEKSCTNCIRGQGPFNGCYVLSKEAPWDAHGEVQGCANCYFVHNKQACSVKGGWKGRAGDTTEASSSSAPPPPVAEWAAAAAAAAYSNKRPRLTDSDVGTRRGSGLSLSMEDEDTKPRRKIVKLPLPRKLAAQTLASAGDLRASAKREGAANATGSPSSALISAGQFQPEVPLEMEDWEIAPGRIREAGVERVNNIAFSKTFLETNQSVPVSANVTFEVKTIKSGHSLELEAVGTNMRYCSLASGKLRVSIQGQPDFTIGPSGMFKVKPGLKFSVLNRLYVDSVLHITSTPSQY